MRANQGEASLNIKLYAKALTFYVYNSFVSKIPCYAARHVYLHNITKIQLGFGSSIHMGCFFAGRHVSIGSNSVINRGCFLDGREGVQIGNNVSLGVGTAVLSMSHDPQSPDFAPVREKTIIGDFVWTGYRALILPGAHLGEGAVVGAGAVVTRPVEPYTIVAGNPARKIGERNRNLTYNLHYRPLFNTDIE